MLFIMKVPTTASEASTILDKLQVQAVEVMQPTNRRRLGQRRNYLNACYDQVQQIANLHANNGDKKWEAIATRVSNDKSILQITKEQMQLNDITLY